MKAAGTAIIELAPFVLLGAVTAFCFFWSLRRVVAGYLQGGAAWRTLVLQLLRLLLLGGLFWLAARSSAAALLSMLAGFQLARFATIRVAARSQ